MNPIEVVDELIDVSAKVTKRAQAVTLATRAKSLVTRTLGESSVYLERIDKIRFGATPLAAYASKEELRQALKDDVDALADVLRAIRAEVAISEPAPSLDTLAALRRIADRFHAVARQLRQRHGGRDTLDVGDEYDVQDLMHALLRLWFDDVRPEDPAPSHGGASSRVDFVLKPERTVVEIKMTRPGLNAKKLGEELIVDRERYRAHPDCDTLVCFVYDPHERLTNPSGLEADLAKDSGPHTVVLIRSR